jgi:hypothetical protein
MDIKGSIPQRIHFTIIFFDDIQQKMSTFSHIYLSYIYMDKNKVVVGLSKEALVLEWGTWTISIFQDGHTNDFSNAP